MVSSLYWWHNSSVKLCDAWEGEAPLLEWQIRELCVQVSCLAVMAKSICACSKLSFSMSHLVFSILSPSNYEVLLLILASTGRHSENTILWDNHLFLKRWQPWKNFLIVRNQHRAVLSKAPKVILFVDVFIKHLLWLSWSGDDFSTWLGKYSSLQHLFNIYLMAGMCSVQEIKANSSSSRS